MSAEDQRAFVPPSARRRAMLQDMDIPLWVLRARLSDVSMASPDTAQRPPQPTESSRARLQALQSDLDAPSSGSRPDASPGPRRANAPAAGRRPTGPALDMGTMPAALQCTWLGAHAYVGRHYAEPAIRRFLRDLLVAAADNQSSPTQLPFDAADLVGRVGLEQARLGLSAFIAKRLGAIGAGTLGAQALLLDEALVNDLPGVAGDHYRVADSLQVPLVVVPDLRTLQDDGPAKRQLWLQLLALRRR